MSELEMISVGSCPTCGGPAQFIAGENGAPDWVRHIDLTEAAHANAAAEIERLQARLAAAERVVGQARDVVDAPWFGSQDLWNARQRLREAFVAYDNDVARVADGGKP